MPGPRTRARRHVVIPVNWPPVTLSTCPCTKFDHGEQRKKTPPAASSGVPEQMRQMASFVIPLGRPGTPEEAAGGVFFLCSPWSNYVSGQVLNVTGGQRTGMTT